MKKKVKHEFRDSVIQNIFSLVKLNLIFMVCCLSVIGIPAGINAMTKVTMQIRKGDSVYVVGDFMEALRKGFLKATLYGFAIIAAGLVLGYIFWFYATMQALSGLVLTVLRCMTLLPLLLLYCGSCYLWVMNNKIDLPVRELFSNALFLAVICWKESGICILVGVLICVVTLCGLPYTMPFLMVFGVVFWNYTCTYYVEPMIEKYVVHHTDEPAL